MYDILIDELSGGFAAVSPTIAGIRLIMAVILGGIIGFEREWRHKPAGLRTHILVSTAACLFIIVSQQLASMQFGPENAMRVDPLRLIEAVTAGVAFLAAGIIFTSHGKVRNATTGASMWLCGAIGLACGSGQMPLAVMATFIVLAVLSILGMISHHISGDRE